MQCTVSTIQTPVTHLSFKGCTNVIVGISCMINSCCQLPGGCNRNTRWTVRLLNRSITGWCVSPHYPSHTHNTIMNMSRCFLQASTFERIHLGTSYWRETATLVKIWKHPLFFQSKKKKCLNMLRSPSFVSMLKVIASCLKAVPIFVYSRLKAAME